MSEAILIHLIYVGASVGCIIIPLKRSRSRACWARCIFFTVAGIFMLMAVCGLALDFQFWNPSKFVRLRLESYLQGIRGFLLGCMFVLFVSRELMGKKIVKGEVAT